MIFPENYEALFQRECSTISRIFTEDITEQNFHGLASINTEWLGC